MADFARSNPFATRYIRPGALEFVWPAGDSLHDSLARLEQQGWWGQIVGPHGSGKSTLLAAFVPAIQAAGRRTIVFELHAGERRLPDRRAKLRAIDGQSVVVVDGYEQLGRLQRWRLQRACRARGSGLLVTAHASLGLPTLVRTQVDAKLAVSLTRKLLDADTAIVDQDVCDALAAHGGDLREAFFALYDLYELRRRREA